MDWEERGMSPIYEYRCPECGATQMERQISQTGPWKFREGK